MTKRKKQIISTIVVLTILFIVAAIAIIYSFTHANENSYKYKQQSTSPLLTDSNIPDKDDSMVSPEATEKPKKIKKGMLKNTEILTAKDMYGNVLTLGNITEKVSDNKEGIILSPRYSNATSEHHIGYYMQTNFGYIIGNNTSNTQESNFIVRRTYDKLDKATDAYWTYNAAEQPPKNISVYIRSIDLTSHTMLGLFRADIIKNTDGTYKLTKLVNNDIRYTSVENNNIELKPDETETTINNNQPPAMIQPDTATPENSTALVKEDDVRNILVDKAIEAIDKEKIISTTETFNKGNVLVEQVEMPYFTQLYNKGHNIVSRTYLPKNMYAVTVNSRNSTTGYITMYFTSTKYDFAGYDFLHPFTEKSIPKAYTK